MVNRFRLYIIITEIGQILTEIGQTLGWTEPERFWRVTEHNKTHH